MASTPAEPDQGIPNTPGAGEAVVKAFWRLVDLTPYLVGGILLEAAALKIQQLAEGRWPESDFFSTRWFQAALVDVEVLSGLSLMYGRWPGPTRKACQALFAAFLAFSIYRLTSGAKTCGCLGSLEMAPLATIGLDVIVLAALGLWSPRFPLPGRRMRLLPHLLIAFGLVVGVSLLASAAPKDLVWISPRVMDLGKVAQGDRRSFTALVRNLGNRQVLISRVEISCPCLAWRQLPLVLKPLDESHLDFELDLAKEPGFTGPLLIEAKGWADGAELAFLITVKVTVEPDDGRQIRQFDRS